jgi:Domain of unknown function (DUF4390)
VNRRGRIAAWLSLLLLAGFASSATLDGKLEVQSAYVTVREGVFELNARTIYPLNDDIRTALTDGIKLEFALQAVVNRQRRYWFDKTMIDVTLRRELFWHAVSERYVLRDPDRGEQQLFASLDQALAAAGVVAAWPVVVEPQLKPDSTYTISVRADIRRGRLPDTLRTLMWWSESWNRSSEWYTWTLPR